MGAGWHFLFQRKLVWLYVLYARECFVPLYRYSVFYGSIVYTCSKSGAPGTDECYNARQVRGFLRHADWQTHA